MWHKQSPINSKQLPDNRWFNIMRHSNVLEIKLNVVNVNDVLQHRN